MPKVKHTALRLRIIDACIRNPYKPYPSMDYLREVCEEKLYGSSDGANLSKSAIEKDIKYLKDEYDAPLKYSKSNGGYYYENKDFSIDSIPLNSDEAQSLRFAAITLNQYSNLAVFKQFKGAIQKVLDGTFISDDLEDTQVENYVQFEWAPTTQGSEWLNQLFTAIKNKQRIKLNYYSFKSHQHKNYLLEPYLLREYKHQWYLIAYRVEDGYFSSFQLGRVEAMQLLEDYFVRSQEFQAETYFKHAFGITVLEGSPVLVKLKMDISELPYLTENPIHQTQIIQNKTETHFEVLLHVFVTKELKMSLLSFGSKCKVLEPTDLKIEMLEEVKRCLEG